MGTDVGGGNLVRLGLGDRVVCMRDQPFRHGAVIGIMNDTDPGALAPSAFVKFDSPGYCRSYPECHQCAKTKDWIELIYLIQETDFDPNRSTGKQGTDTASQEDLTKMGRSTSKFKDVEFETVESHLIKVHHDFEPGTSVYVKGFGRGALLWIGKMKFGQHEYVAGLEMEDERDSFNNGMFLGKQVLETAKNHCLFVSLSQCERRSPSSGQVPEQIYANGQAYVEQLELKRQLEDAMKETPQVRDADAEAYGVVKTMEPLGYRQTFCNTVSSYLPGFSWKENTIHDALVGENKGIPGNAGSTYIDSSLCGLFFNNAFKELLDSPKIGEYPETTQVREILRQMKQDLHYPPHLVSTGKMVELQGQLDQLRQNPDEAQDPGEFLDFLFEKLLFVSPFLQFSNSQSSFVYSIFGGGDPNTVIPSTQLLFDQSLDDSKMHLVKEPPCLILQMPRSENQKQFEQIFPSLQLDVRIAPKPLVNTSRSSDDARMEVDEEFLCFCCGKLPDYECLDCGHRKDKFNKPIGGIPYCEKCLGLSHNQMKRTDHKPDKIMAEEDLYGSGPSAKMDTERKIQLDLFAVICIEKVNYVAFIRFPSQNGDRWLLMDSLAHYNDNRYTPEIKDCTDAMTEWLSVKKFDDLTTKASRKRRSWGEIPHPVRRILCDGYMYMYQPVQAI